MKDPLSSLVIFSDLDGTLLDAQYSWSAAQAALDVVYRHRIPLVLCSSKTRTEMEAIRRAMTHRDPFIVENGGAVCVPAGSFPTPVPGGTFLDGYEVVELGVPYDRLRAALQDMAHTVGAPLLGFGDMKIEEVMSHTGLSRDEAVRAMNRRYDEPFLAPPGLWDRLDAEARARGLRCTKGGRFYHLLGTADKGYATRYLVECYRRVARSRSVGIGDSLNDLPMLEVVDVPIAVQRADGSYDPTLALPHLVRAEGIGPVGWAQAILSELQRAEAGPGLV